jgi:hypothetical protein
MAGCRHDDRRVVPQERTAEVPGDDRDEVVVVLVEVNDVVPCCQPDCGVGLHGQASSPFREPTI